MSMHRLNTIANLSATSGRNILLQANRILAGVALVFLAGLPLIMPAKVAAADDLKPYPQAEAGYRRVVIRLPVVDAPDDRRVELIIGKMMETDCNRHFFTGQLARKVAQGWGYDYFILNNVQGPASTLMACPPGESKRATFVRVNLDQSGALNGWQRYNPKLPIVIYVSESIEVRYRVWTAGEQTDTARAE